jgi:hypothetical protein
MGRQAGSKWTGFMWLQIVDLITFGSVCIPNTKILIFSGVLVKII